MIMLGTALWPGGNAALAHPGDAVIKKMDAALSRARDQTMEVEMVVADPGKATRRLLMQVHTRADKRRIRFLSPGDVKGLTMLVLTRTQMYVYLPAYRKIRRIASHVRAQTMFGADYNYDDMSTVSYGGVYLARTLTETKKHWTVRAALRPGQQSPYAKLEFRILKDNHLPDRIAYFNDQGKRVKSEVRGDYRCEKGVCGAWMMKMVDHTRNEHWTKLVRKSWALNSDFSDRIFSLRQLQRGR